MSGKRDETNEERRSFLKLMGAAAPLAAATAVGATEAEAAEEVQSGSGLRKTPHVEAYLASARF